MGSRHNVGPKREPEVAKAEKVEAKNVELTQRGVLKKKECASTSKASRMKKNKPSSAASLKGK